MTQQEKKTCLYFVPMPIGHRQDITLRSLEILGKSSMIIFEEYRVGKKNLDLLKIDLEKKEIDVLNEHTTFLEKKLLLKKIQQHENVSFISDVGSPIFADPGWELANLARKAGTEVKTLPGANCLLVALCSSGFSLEQFFYLGFLPRNEQDRQQYLKNTRTLRTLLVILETPYRLQILLKSIEKCFPSKTPVALCMSMTSEEEEVFRGSLGECYQRYAHNQTKNKKPFVLILDHRDHQNHRSHQKKK